MNKIEKLLKKRGYSEYMVASKPMSMPREKINEILDIASKINIVGDYDCDGFASIYVAVTILREFGFDVEYYIPDRLEEGYGISIPVIDRMRDCDLVITVDNGTVANEALSYLQDKDIVSFVTDHHAADTCIATVCINPNCAEISDPEYQNLCGAQVIYSVLSNIISADDTTYDYTMMQCLPWVMLATIADMVKIDNRNYKFCEYVLDSLRNNSDNTSFNALLDVLKIDHKYLTVDDIGYLIGPTINAVGRMDDMTLAVDAALTENYKEARKKWAAISKFNKERKKATSEGEELVLESDNVIIDDNVIVAQADIHAGVVGIVASRLKEKHNKPAIVFNAEGKASCRSVAGFHFRDALIQCDKYLVKYGGHSMAAGLTVKPKKEKAFAKAINKLANSIPLQDERLVIDVDANDVYDLANVYVYSVWGSGNEKPLLRSKFLIWQINAIKETHTSMILDSFGSTFDAMYFNTLLLKKREGEYCYLTYEITLNSFNKNRSYTLIVRSIEYEND